MRFNSKHIFDGTEDYSDKTFGEIGIPPLHVVKGRQGIETKYYEFTADYDLVFGKK